MNTIIEKLIYFLDKNIEQLRAILIDSLNRGTIVSKSKEYYIKLYEISQRKNIRNFISVPQNEWINCNEIFISFDELSPILSESKLRTRDKLEIIMLIFEKNMATNLLNKTIDDFELPILANYPFKFVKFDEAKEFINNNNYKEILKNKKRLTPLEELKLEEIEKVISENSLNIEQIIKCHKIIKEHYFDKLDDIDKLDIECIINVLKYFKLSKELITEINGYFNSILEKKEKRKKRELEEKNNNETVVRRESTKVNTISKKEYYYLNKELKKYYDLENKCPIKPLSLEEQIYFVYLLKKLNINDNKINDILNRINKLSSNHPVARFTRLYDKFKYYSNDEQIQFILNELDEYFSQIFICCDDDYEIIKMFFEDDLNKLLELIPNNYEYEHQKAKELIIKKND